MKKEIIWTSKEAQIASGGKVTGDFGATGINIDSRLVEKGDLFIALTTGASDGHCHVKAAFENGAAAALVSKIPEDLDESYPLVIVDDTLEALNKMALYKREKTAAKIIAVTGSVGKTSVKDAIYDVLAAQGKAHKTQGNYNNFLGLPITLCRMADDVDYGVFELGMNHAGELSELTKMLAPHIAIVTAIEAVHMEFFDSVLGIVDAKSEIFEGLSEQKTAIIPYDSVHYKRLLNNSLKYADETLSFGEGEGANSRSLSIEINEENQSIIANILDNKLSYYLLSKAHHTAINSLAVLAAVKSTGADVEAAAKTLSNLQPPEGRGRSYPLEISAKKVTLIDDSYNASPASTRAAIENLANFDGRKIAILGDMLELGEEELEYHRSLKEPLITNKIDKIIVSGSRMKHLYDILPCEIERKYCTNIEDVIPAILADLQSSDVLLVKGSHGSNMWCVAKDLKEKYAI